MRKLIVDTLGLIDEHDYLEEVMSFYRDGLKGLVADYLDHYLEFNSILQGDDERDLMFFDRVLELYATSPEHLVRDFANLTSLGEVTVMMACYAVSTATWQMVEIHHRDLRASTLINPARIDLGLGYVGLPLLI